MSFKSNEAVLPGLQAVASLTSNQFYWVKMSSTAGKVKVVNATTDEPIGILQNAPAAGVEAEVQYQGVAKVIAGTSAGWNEGVRVGWNTTGKAVPLAINGTNDNRRAGARFHKFSGQSTVALNQIISVVLFPGAWRI